MRVRSGLGLAAVTALLTALVAAPAGAGPGPEYVFDPDEPLRLGGSFVGIDAIATEGVETVTGSIAGAVYVGQVPDDWNGDLVVWAHGYRGEGDEGALRLYVDPPPVREWLLDEGYAWIASSYRRNSYDPGVGVLDTKNAVQRAQQLFGRADDVFIAGASMGGHVTVASIEQFPSLYDGALPACGVLGDNELFDYFLDYNVGAAAFAGLAADEIDYPSDDWIAGTVDAEVKPALSLYDDLGLDVSTWAFDGGIPGVPDLLVGPGEAFKDFVEVGSGGERVTYDAAWDYWHFAGAGNFFFDLGQGDGGIANRRGVASRNDDMRYDEEYAGVDGGIDDVVVRVEAAARIRNAQGVKPSIIVDGDPDVPVLTIHTTGDLFVPIEMEQVYAREVIANGKQHLLVQRAIRDVGHCTFTEGEWIASFADLFDWVETGDRPDGDDLIGGISAADLGCDWTIDDGTGGTDLRPLFACP